MKAKETDGMVSALDRDAIRMLIPDDELVGVQAITERLERGPCTLGCLTPGSSDHTHMALVGWRIIGTGRTVETDINLIPTLVRLVWPLDVA